MLSMLRASVSNNMSKIQASCHCNDLYDLNIDLHDSKATPFEKPVVQVNFGEVRVGSEKSRRVSISNNDNVAKNYVVKYNSNTASVYHFFKAPNRCISIPPQTTIKIKITYAPLIAWSVDHDFISIVSPNDEETRIEVSGRSVGPQLQISTNTVGCNTWPQMRSSKKAVEIRNLSAFPVEFKFDADDKPSPIFEIAPQSGVIDGKRHVVVNITFRATTFGEYSQRFFCTIHNHHPLIVDCMGIYWNSEASYNEARGYVTNQCETFENSFVAYMQDVQVVAPKKPKFSLIDVHLNFGTLEYPQKKESTLVTSVTNHQEQAIIVKWYPDEYFILTPNQMQIPPNESVLFECNFRPTSTDDIFSRQLLFNVFPTEIEPDQIVSIPDNGIMRVLGHSFNEPHAWVPQFSMNPRVVVLPPVLPGDTSFATLELRASGYLPTSFSFISPTTTNFLVKPMIGTIRRLTIVVIQLINAVNCRVFSEQWHIMLNNDKKHRVGICLKGYAEYPSVVIGSDNTITIKGVQVGCEEIVSVPIRNTCQLYIHYEFMTCEFPEEVTILTPSGPLSANDSGTIRVSFKSSTRVCKQFPVTCLVYAIRDQHQIRGSPVEIPVTIYVEADHSELCCIPSRHDFGTVECHSHHTNEFCLFNYGHTTIHYELSVYWRHVVEPYENATVTPVCGTLEPKAHVHCGINFDPHEPGAQYARVCYKLRPDLDSSETIPNTEKFIYQFRAKVVSPYFQIVEIADHNFGPLFSKRALWECLNINWLNYALAETRRNQAPTYIDLDLPDAEMNNKYFYVTLMVRNMTQFPVQVSLKRKKLCDCAPQEVGAFLSIRRRVYQCPHREMCKLSIMEETISPYCHQPMTLQLGYFSQGENTLSYQLITNERRFIFLNFKMNTIAFDEVWLSKYTSTYYVLQQPISIGAKQPSLQAFWFYNNSSTPVGYELSESNFDRINEDFQFEVWKCLNPTGIINEHEAHPLLLRYHPLENKIVLVQVPLQISNGQTVELKLRARGCRTNLPNKVPKLYLPRAICPYVPVHLSMDRLRIEAFPVWSSTTRMIFITNMSDDILGYNWLKSEVQGLCSVDVIAPNRVLRPKQTDVVIVQVKSFDKACTTRVHLTCQLISHTKYLQHQQSVQNYQRRQEEIKDEFIITDEGVSYPENDIEIMPKAEFFFNTLAIEIEIKSHVDRDHLFTPYEQFQHAPQRIFNATIDTLPHKNNKPCISFLSKPIRTPPPSINSSYNDDLYVEKNPNEFDPARDNVGFYKKVVEALIADTIFSNRFREVLKVQKNVEPIYYSQIRPQIDKPQDTEKHVKDMYNEPQMPLVKDIMHDLLLKSFDEIFALKTEKSDLPIDYKTEVDFARRNTYEEKC